MMPATSPAAPAAPTLPGVGELLILPDGRILAHSITPALALLLAELAPAGDTMHQRAAQMPIRSQLPPRRS